MGAKECQFVVLVSSSAALNVYLRTLLHILDGSFEVFLRHGTRGSTGQEHKNDRLVWFLWRVRLSVASVLVVKCFAIGVMITRSLKMLSKAHFLPNEEDQKEFDSPERTVRFGSVHIDKDRVSLSFSIV